jgi:hypothetical protein
MDIIDYLMQHNVPFGVRRYLQNEMIMSILFQSISVKIGPIQGMKALLAINYALISGIDSTHLRFLHNILVIIGLTLIIQAKAYMYPGIFISTDILNRSQLIQET